MRLLVPCPSCHRHVESDEAACPFCQAALVPSLGSRVCHGPCSGHASPSLSRAGLVAVGAALLCASCMRSVVYAYGPAIIPDASHPTADASSQADSQGDGSDAKE